MGPVKKGSSRNMATIATYLIYIAIYVIIYFILTILNIFMFKLIKFTALASLALALPAMSLSNINKLDVYALTGPGPTPTPTIVLTPPVASTCGLGSIDFLGQCKKGFEKATFNCKIGKRVIYSSTVYAPLACTKKDELRSQADRICLAVCNKRLDL